MSAGKGSLLDTGTSESSSCAEPAEESKVVSRSLLALPALLALLLSLAGSWIPSFSYDEGATISAASRSWPELFHLLRNIDAVHGFYYFLISPVVHLLGQSEFWVRLPSAIALALAAWGLTLLGLRLLGPRAALASGFVFAVLPITSHYGMEARSYALVAAVTVWATYLLVCAVDSADSGEGTSGNLWLWFGYFALLLLGITLFIYVLLIVAAHALTMILGRPSWRVLAVWAGAAGTSVLVTLPLVGVALSQSKQVSFLTVLFPGSVKDVRIQFIVHPALFTLESVSPILLAATVLLPWAAAATGVVLWLRGKRPHDFRSRTGRRSSLVALTLPWLLLPTLILVTASILFQPTYAPRYVFYGTAPFALLIGFALSLLGRRLLVPIALVCVALAVPWLISDRLLPKKAEVREMADTIAARKEPGDAIILVLKARRREISAYPQAIAGLSDVMLKASPAETGSFTGELFPVAEMGERLEGVQRVWTYGRIEPTNRQLKELKQFKDAGFHEAQSWGRGRLLSLWVK